VSSPKAIYLEGAADPIFAVLHRPTSRFAQDTAVILCPTFWHKINRASAKRALATLGWAFGAPSRRGRPMHGGDPLDLLVDRLRQSGKHVRSSTSRSATTRCAPGGRRSRPTACWTALSSAS
jgi:hypothetical protein